MKVTVTKEFGSPEEAAAWLRVFSPAPAFVVPEPIRVDASGAASNEPTPPTATDKKPRKPRNDAGKPRGPYKTNGGPASSNPGVPESALAPTPQPAEPVSPTNAAAPEKASAEAIGGGTGTTAGGATPVPAVPSQGAEGKTVSGSAPAAAAPTIDDARAALALINKTPGMGMPAVMLHLQDFNTNRASLLKPEQYAAFIASAKQKVADHEAAAARDKAPK